MQEGGIYMSEIVLTRIDSRLIHGQIYSQWCNECGCNLILVVNNETAASSFKQGLMDMAVPSSISTLYWSIPQTVARFNDDMGEYKVFLIVDKPSDLVPLVEAGIPIEKVNIGNLQLQNGRHQVTSSVAVNGEDIDAFRKLRDKGIELYIQSVPSKEIEDDKLLFLD